PPAPPESSTPLRASSISLASTTPRPGSSTSNPPTTPTASTTSCRERAARFFLAFYAPSEKRPSSVYRRHTMADDRRRKGGGEDATTVEPETLPKKEREGIVQWDDNGELTIVLDCGRYSVDPPGTAGPVVKGKRQNG